MAVLSADEKDFAAQVNADIRDRASRDVHDALRSPENIDRWITHLKKMKRDTESQLAAYTADIAEGRATINTPLKWVQFKAEKERWRSDAIRFKNGTENKLDEATFLRATELTTLRTAIRNHFNALSPSDDSADNALWSVLNDY